MALARSIVRLAYEGPKGKYGAKTVIVFDSAEQWTVVERPETLLSFAGAHHDQPASAPSRIADERSDASRPESDDPN
jgi:hypothetical protein